MEHSVISRFWSSATITDDALCWRWCGSTWPSTGYGRFFVEGKYIGAHRVAWALGNNRDPRKLPTSVVIRHRCDNPICVNPAHLEPGSIRDNTRDCVERGRHASAFREGRCRRGHDVTNPDNVYILADGHPRCAVCNRAAARRNSAVKRSVR